MADDVKLVFAGDSAGAEKAIATLERKFEALEQKIKRLKTASKAEPTFIDSMANSAGAAASAITGISGPMDVMRLGLQQIGAEWDAIVQRQERAKQASVSYAQTLEQLYINAVGDPSFPDLKTADKTVRELSTKTGVEPKDVANALNTAIASKGNMAAGTDIAMTDKVLSLIPLSTGSHSGMITGGLGLQQQLPGTTPEQTLGFVMKSAQNSKVGDNELYVKNALPAIVGGVMTDETKDARGAAAIYNAITQASGDTEGRRSRTAAIALELQLKTFLEDEPQLKSHIDRVRFMQETPEAARAFLKGGEFKGKKRGGEMTVTGPDGEEYTVGGKKASFQRQMEPAIESLLTGGSLTAKMLEDFYRDTPEVKDAGQFYGTAVKDFKENPTMQVANASKRMDAFANGMQLENIEDATADVIYKGMQRGIEDAGGSALSTTKSWLRFTGRRILGQDPREAAENTLKDAIQDNSRNVAFTDREQKTEDAFSNRLQSVIDRINTLGSPGNPQAQQPDPNQAKAVEVLQKMDEKLGRLVERDNRMPPRRAPGVESN